MYYYVAPATIVHGEHSLFTYYSGTPIPIGTIVTIEVGKRRIHGVIFSQSEKPSFATKPIVAAVTLTPLPLHLLKVCEWMSAYYATHMAQVLQTILPAGINKKRRENTYSPTHHQRNRTNNVLNEDQSAALNTIIDTSTGSVLLHGVTGSGKTQVYIEMAQKIVAQGKSVIVLVPEIALTSQLVAEFAQHFADPIITHSTMTEAQRHLAWQKCLDAETPQVIVGPRSALFMPLKNLGLIVIDECHESSYKQDQNPRYSALRVASVLAKHANAKVILGSATPNISDTFLALHAERPIVRMLKPARHDVVTPSVAVIDMTDKNNFTRHRFISNKLLEAIDQTLADGNQSLVFHNRRGSAPLTLCEHCGWMANCPTCFLPLTLHTDTHTLKCHTCGLNAPIPPHCPVCREPDIIHRGIGTKMVADELQKQFPRATIARFDADTDNGEQLHHRYQELYDGKIDIIIGTQVIAKGLDLPHLRTVGVVQADSGLAIPDYQSPEKVFQLIYQVVGRVGRNHHETQVIVQTFQPTHPSVKLGLTQQYDAFYEYAIAERKRAYYPPFCHLLKLTCSYATEQGAVRAATKLSQQLRRELGADMQLLGPTPSFYERLGGTYRWQLIVKAPSRETLIRAAKLTPKQHWFVDLDPANLL